MRSSSMRVGLDIESPLSGSSNGALPPEQGSWRLRDVSIRRLLSQQDWGGLAATVAICIGLLIAEVCPKMYGIWRVHCFKVCACDC